LIPVKENQQDVVFISVWGRDFQSQVKQCRYAALVLPVGMRGDRQTEERRAGKRRRGGKNEGVNKEQIGVKSDKK
jgi:hypothetical protein